MLARGAGHRSCADPEHADRQRRGQAKPHTARANQPHTSEARGEPQMPTTGCCHIPILRCPQTDGRDIKIPVAYLA